MKKIRYFFCSILLFFNDNWMIAKDEEEANEFYEQFHSTDTLY